jgi:hypothetical protein
MALIACKECNKEISTAALACPGCGAPTTKGTPKKNSPVLKIITILILGLFVVAIFNSKKDFTDQSDNSAPDVRSGGGATTITPSVPALEVDAFQLDADYHANEVSADMKYKGKLLRVTGVVESINKDISDDAWIGLAAANEFMVTHASGLSPNQVVNLKKGESITITCTGAGMLIESPMLKDCHQSAALTVDQPTGDKQIAAPTASELPSRNTLPSANQGDAPKFKDYPSEALYNGENHPLVMDDEFAKNFRTRLKETIKDGRPNFAGRYITTSWGCGSGGCISGAIIDATTGRAYPWPVSVSGVYPLKQQFEKENGQEVIYRPNSRLIVFAGNLDGATQGDGSDSIEFYEFKDEKFVFLKSIPYGRKGS